MLLSVMHHTCQIHVSSVEMGAEYAIAFKKKKKKMMVKACEELVWVILL